jgi:hypothetical protein
MIKEELAEGSWATGGKRYTYKEKDGQLDSGAKRNSILTTSIMDMLKSFNGQRGGKPCSVQCSRIGMKPRFIS